MDCLVAKGFPETKKLIEKEGFFVKELEMSVLQRRRRSDVSVNFMMIFSTKTLYPLLFLGNIT
jgi:hypothetical protein